MKLLFLLIELTLNFLIYLTPGLALYYIWMKWKHKPLFAVNLGNFFDRMLTLTPFGVWALFFLFDPEQKTVRQMLYPDPFIIGFFTIIFLMLNHHNPEHNNSAKRQWSYIAITNLIAISCWFLINPLD